MKFEVLFESVMRTEDYTVYESGDVTWWREGGDLKGAPRKVKGSFYCRHRNLESLEGAPEAVGWEFDCSDNPLQSLKHIPYAARYKLPEGFTPEDVKKEHSRKKFVRGLDPETADTFGDFIREL